MIIKQQPMGIGWKREGDHVVGHVVAVEPDGSRKEVARTLRNIVEMP